MDAVIDLSSRAVSFITVIQDILIQINAKKQPEAPIYTLIKRSEDISKAIEEYVGLKDASSPNKRYFNQRALELIWISEKETDEQIALNHSFKRGEKLITWLWNEKRFEFLMLRLPENTHFPLPEQWRDAIRAYLYRYKEERYELAKALNYLPVQIILASVKKLSSKQQRLLQEWDLDENAKLELLDTAEIKFLKKNESKVKIGLLQAENKDLIEELITNGAPLSFEYIFDKELDEVEAARKNRSREQHILNKNTDSLTDVHDGIYTNVNLPYNTSAQERAKAMKLTAMAFSGGGIRSATFNLGILQAFAKNGLLPKIDYLSTVSGGGYIGSWFAAWVKRDRSVLKVSDRLDPDKSHDPMAEEVRPIRWLRMYSNYLAPNAGVFSVDTITMVLTWLRNTLLNQLIILFILLGIFQLGSFFYNAWAMFLNMPHQVLTKTIFSGGSILIFLGAILAGWGMYAFDKVHTPKSAVKPEFSERLSYTILLLGFLFSAGITAWIVDRSNLPETTYLSVTEKFKYLAVTIPVAFGGLILVAILGRYDRAYLIKLNEDKHAELPQYLKISNNILIIVSSFIAASIGALFLALAWKLFDFVHTNKAISIIQFNHLGFVVGIPLVLEALSIAVIIRMALLGRLFPDERREWWGRLGAIIHRFSLVWIIFFGSALFGTELWGALSLKIGQKVTVAGGWLAVIGTAVKMAYSSITNEEDTSKGALKSSLDMFVRFAPYLFIFGLLILLPPLSDWLYAKALLYSRNFDTELLKQTKTLGLVLSFMLVLALGSSALLLAWRMGVNEFSMHYFYRNRLSRAYLGATRRPTERRKTTNLFTGFDAFDDLNLSCMTTDKGYYGPYPILNTAMNASDVSELDRQDRKAESFIFSPLYCGFDFSRTRASTDAKQKSYDYSYRQTESYAYPLTGGPKLGTAMAISGAAANPNQGYHSSPATAFLLTVFNVRLGWWIGNPRSSKWNQADPKLGLNYILYDLIGKSQTNKNYVCLSDGGHFDNMGVYELVRRRVSTIILGDSEQDNTFSCEGLANAIRRCRIDFGVEISIDISKITNRNEQQQSDAYFAIGSIKYPGDVKPSGKLIYIKSSIKGDEPVDVKEYAFKNKEFPHQSTGDQFFDESQFESYRRIGLHIGETVIADPDVQRILNIKSENLPMSSLSNFIKRLSGVE